MSALRCIWKYHLNDLNSVKGGHYEVVIYAPVGARALAVMLDHGNKPCLYMEVTPEGPPVPFTLYSIGTGHGAVPAEADYLGTVLVGDYVWHIYVPKVQP